MAASDETMLSERERALLARLEARAAADDPSLAARLRGRRPRRETAATALAVAVTLLAARPLLWGPLLVVLGVAVTVAGVAAGVVVGLLGACCAAVGLAMLTRAAADRMGAGR